MSISLRPRRARTVTLALGALATAGCAQAIDTGLALAGVKPTSTDHGSPAVRARGAPKAVSSVYLHTPPRSWRSGTFGGPYHPNTTLLRQLGPTSCALAPQGVSRVLPVDEGSPPLPLGTYGPLEVGLAGAALGDVESLFAAGTYEVARRMMERTSRLSTYQEGCGFSIFLYVGLAGSSWTDPVLVAM